MATETPRRRPKGAVNREQRLRAMLIGACFAACAPQPAMAGSQEPEKQEPEKKVAAYPVFFEAQDPIEVTLTANIGKLRGDKHDEHPWRPATMSYKGLDGNPPNLPLAG